MKLLFTIKDRKIKITLLEKNREVDYVLIEEEHSLAEKLLPEIDKLLQKNNLRTEDIEKIDVKSDQGGNFTTTRIAETVAKTWEMKE